MKTGSEYSISVVILCLLLYVWHSWGFINKFEYIIIAIFFVIAWGFAGVMDAVEGKK